MPRKPREIIQGAVYHIFSRTMNKESYLEPKKVKYLMVQVLEMALKKYYFELNNYNILHNHIHLMITPLEGEVNISRIMQFIKSQFAQRYNRMMSRSGPVWNERFGDKIVENSDTPAFYCNWMCMYIFYNPVRKEYLSDPRDYEFSCMRFYFEEDYKPKLKITLNKYFLELGKTFKERVQKFLEFEELYVELKIKGSVPG